MKPARYDENTHQAWVRLLGRLHAPLGPSGEHHLEGRQVGVLWPVGCYLGVDFDTTVRYVGKVCRRHAGFATRFAHHRQPVEDWERVWLLPLRVDVAPHVVAGVEALLIRRLRPLDNVVWPTLRMVGRAYHDAT